MESEDIDDVKSFPTTFRNEIAFKHSNKVTVRI